MSSEGDILGRPAMCGGLSSPEYFDSYHADRARACCTLFRGEAEKRLNDGKTFEKFAPIYYQMQSVAGTIYQILVGVGGTRDARVMMTVYWGPGPALPELSSVKFHDDDN
ncbi:uncharacterized protein LOC144927468 [Branchiostoma floridae x Branchiostoma belcheri]